MSSSTTTRVGWVTWSTFCEGLSSGPEAALELILKVGGDWWMRLKGSAAQMQWVRRPREEVGDQWAQLRSQLIPFPATLTWLVRAT